MITDKDIVRDTARAMLERSIDPITGCRGLSTHIVRVSRALANSSAARTIVTYESETDNFPVGDVRQRWAPSALVEWDRQLADYVVRIQDDLDDACRELIELTERIGDVDN